MNQQSLATVSHPLACPRCGCPTSSVLETRRMTASRDNPQPLPGIRRKRECTHCGKQFQTRETLEEIGLQSAVWRALNLSDREWIDPASLPAGSHHGEWTRHDVELTIGGVQYRLNTRNEMRSEAYPCTVIVTAKGVTVESVTTTQK